MPECEQDVFATRGARASVAQTIIYNDRVRVHIILRIFLAVLTEEVVYHSTLIIRTGIDRKCPQVPVPNRTPWTCPKESG